VAAAAATGLAERYCTITTDADDAAELLRSGKLIDAIQPDVPNMEADY